MRLSINSGSCFSSRLSSRPEENSASVIELGDTSIGGGGQGEVYVVKQIDHFKVTDLLVKIFTSALPATLREIVISVRDNNRLYSIDKCTALRALPLFLFTGTLNGKAVEGYVMRQVTGKTFYKIIEEDINDYIKVPLEDRLTFCLQFVEGMHILYSLTIIHADLNGQNLMIDTANRLLAIIDLDGGAVAKTGSAPIAIKLQPGWLAPEIFSQHASTTKQQQVDVNIRADLWSIACGVHHLLFGLPPFFFVHRANDIPLYLQHYAWPQLRNIDKVDINQANASAFQYYEGAFKQVPELHDALKFSFQKGYLDPTQRLTAYDFMQPLRARLLSAAPPPDRTRKIQELSKYIAVALIDGSLNTKERDLILDLGGRLGIAQADVEIIIEDHVKKLPAAPQAELRYSTKGFDNFIDVDVKSGARTALIEYTNRGSASLCGTVATDAPTILRLTPKVLTQNSGEIQVVLDTTHLQWSQAYSPNVIISYNGKDSPQNIQVPIRVKSAQVVTYKVKRLTNWTVLGTAVLAVVLLMYFVFQDITSRTSETVPEFWSPSIRLPSTPNVQRLLGHTDTIEAVVYHPNGKMLASGSHDKTIRLWDATSGLETKRLNVEGDWVDSIVFSPEGRLFAIVSRITRGPPYSILALWDLGREREVTRLESDSLVTSVAFSKDGRYLAWGGSSAPFKSWSIRLWDVGGKREVRRLFGHTGYIRMLAFASNSAVLVSASQDNTARLWDLNTGKEIKRFKVVYPGAVAFSPEGELVLAQNASELNFFKTQGWTEKRRLKINVTGLRSIVFSPSGRQMVLESDRLRLIDVNSGKELWQVLSYNARPVFRPDGNQLAWAWHHRLALWNVSSGLKTITFDKANFPPIPYNNFGACPGEGCRYGELTAKTDIQIRKDIGTKSPVIFSVKKGEEVSGVTGTVITLQPGVAEAISPVTIDSIRLRPGELAYILHYEGEGVWKAWSKGKVTKVGGKDFENLEVISLPETAWWVKIRNSSGKEGWTDKALLDYKEAP